MNPKAISFRLLSSVLAVTAALLAACGRKAPAGTEAPPNQSVENQQPPSVSPPAESQVDPREHSFQSTTCANNDEYQAAIRVALEAQATVLRCLLPNGQESLRLPIGRDGVRAPTALALVYHRLMESMPEAERRRELAAQRQMARGHANWRSHSVAMASPTASQRKHGLVEGTVTAAAPVAGVTAYELLLSDGATLVVVYPRIDASFVPRGARMRAYGLWGERNGTVVLFPYWIEAL